MSKQFRESTHQVTGQLITALVDLGYGVAVKRIGDNPRLTAFVTDDLGAVEYYAAGHTVLECVINLYDLIERERKYNERPV